MNVGETHRRIGPPSVREVASSVIGGAVSGAGIGGVTALGHEVFKR